MAMMVSFGNYQDPGMKEKTKSVSSGYPVEVWKDKTKRTLISVYGFPVK